MLQLGLTPSHFSFRFLQIIHARRFGFGTLELSGMLSRVGSSASLGAEAPRWPLPIAS